jgi:hypothetical protein
MMNGRKEYTDAEGRTFYYERGARIYLDGGKDTGTAIPSAEGSAAQTWPAMDGPEAPEFKKLNGKVYWGDRVVKGADYHTFTPLNHLWARDSRHIYVYDSRLRGVERDSFLILNPLFAKDRTRVYFLSGTIREASAPTFRALDAGWFLDDCDMVSYQGYGADDMNVFHYVLTVGKPRRIKAADVATFRVLDYGFAVDKAQVYYEGVRLPRAEPAKFRILGHLYSTDDTRVYYLNRPLIGADPATFTVRGKDQLDASDKNQRYYRGEVA